MLRAIAWGVDRDEDAARRALAKLEALLAASPVGIAFFDRELRYVRINDALATINGRPADEHIGRHLRDVLPDAATVLEPLLRGVLESGQPMLNVQWSGIAPSTPSELRHFLATFFPVRIGDQITGVGGVVVEVTAFENAKRALEASEARLNSIIEHAPVGIFVVDEQGTFVLANEKISSVLGRPGEDIVGHRSSELLPPELDRAHRETDHQVLREGKAMQVEEVAPSPEGLRTFISIKFPLPEEGGRRFVCGISTEITERKRIEAQLEAAMRAREETLAIVSHDLRNPLNTVQLSASMLQTHVTDDRARRHIEVIQRSCARMEHLIEDLLATASIQSGTLALETTVEDADSIVDESLELHQPLATESGIQIVRAGAVRGVKIRCDRNRVLQVFANLLGNALKFCRAGDQITLDAVALADSVQFSVADTGPGVPPDVAPYLFEAFRSAHSHRTIGTGLGLYIAKGIVESHGGTIWVDTEPRRGSRFSFTIPRTRS